ncbi:zeta toxin family protein [Enterococcus faecalis EnGen0409]|nr:zeta toxin family protein [Enterococcus faecalis EnGen0409]
MTEDYSLQYAKENKKVLISSITDGKEKEEEKTAIFMAGSPGAGKTEAAQTLTALNNNLCIIDADKFRVLFPGYVGNNSDEFQRGSALLVDAALDLVLKKGYSFILDGTFATSKVNQILNGHSKRIIMCLSIMFIKIHLLLGILPKSEKKLKDVLFLKNVLSMLFSNQEKI